MRRPEENHRPVTCHWKTLSHNVVSSLLLCDNKFFVYYWNLQKKIYFAYYWKKKSKNNEGNAKRGISPHLKIWPSDLDLWPWKSIGFQILLRIKYVPSLVKIHWRMLILECSQGCYAVKIWPGDLWLMTLKINRAPDFPKD